jgi:Secretion system C-terminal sorting domain
MRQAVRRLHLEMLSSMQHQWYLLQPTCTVLTGGVVLSGLPSGTWTLTRTPGGVTTTGNTASRTITGLAVGTYTYTVKNSAGCTSLSSASIVLTAATGCLINPPSSSMTFTLSPNPAQDKVLLNTNISQDGDYRLILMDGLGKVILSKTDHYFNGFNSETLDISNLSKGFYYIRLAHIDGVDFAVKKLIIN